MNISFLKMHGSGNDFVVIDQRSAAVPLSETLFARMAKRRYGIGCDQIVVLEHSDVADVTMRIHNADGGEVGACGNATRCVGWLLMQETGKPHITIETRAGILTADDAGKARVKVNMGAPRLDWRSIPLVQETDVQQLPVRYPGFQHGMAVNMGNPHAVYFVQDVDGCGLLEYGPKIEHDPLFPERTNVEAVQVLGRDRLQVRVWERGSGETHACGTGACAAAVAAHLRGKVDDNVTVELIGGELEIEWQGEGKPVWMTGDVALVYKGEMTV